MPSSVAVRVSFAGRPAKVYHVPSPTTARAALQQALGWADKDCKRGDMVTGVVILPAGKARAYVHQGKTHVKTGKVGSCLSTGLPTAEYDSAEGRIWLRADGHVVAD